jgi:hypothetical protein
MACFLHQKTNRMLGDTMSKKSQDPILICKRMHMKPRQQMEGVSEMSGHLYQVRLLPWPEQPAAPSGQPS